MDSFLSFILILVISFYLLGLLGRLLLRLFVSRARKKFGQNFGGGSFYGQYGRSAYDSRGKETREGEIKVTDTVAGRHKINNKVGEYVDYEEVKTPEKEEK